MAADTQYSVPALILQLYNNYEFLFIEITSKTGREVGREREGTHRSCCVEAVKRVSSRGTALNGPNVANT